MHASLAFVNGAGIADRQDLRLLNTLLSAAAVAESTRPGRDKDEPKAEEVPRDEPQSGGAAISKPDSFKNDPPDPKNPNEVRERHLKKIKR